MAEHTNLITSLLAQTHQGRVFGKGQAFGDLTTKRTQLLIRQAQDTAQALAKRLRDCLQQALPEAPDEYINRNLAEVVPKTAVFVPALTAGDLTGEQNMHNLTLAAAAVGCMYIADQLTDRGDVLMLHAIEGVKNARTAILTQMRANIYELAPRDDAPEVFDCFNQKVLRNEARLHRLSSAYSALGKHAQKTFLAAHAQELAMLMVEDAGFQSVTSVLHAAYRRRDLSLPSITELHGDPSIKNIIQVCNAAARIADEYGDWWMDAGNDPHYGVFSINPFNQYDPTMIKTFCTLAGIDDTQEIEAIQAACQKFHVSDVQRHDAGMYVTGKFFDQMCFSVNTYRNDPARNHRFDTYITLCMRVGEISLINMAGDITLGGD